MSYFALTLEREENRSTQRKTLEAQKKSTAGTLSHETSLTRLGFSDERHNALTACATRACGDGDDDGNGNGDGTDYDGSSDDNGDDDSCVGGSIDGDGGDDNADADDDWFVGGGFDGDDDNGCDDDGGDYGYWC